MSLRSLAAPRLIMVAILVVVSLTHIMSPTTQSTDSRWSLLIASNILSQGHLYLDNFHDIIVKQDNYFIWKAQDHEYSYFPVGVSILALPFVAVYQQWLRPSEIFKMRGMLEKIAASVIVAVTAVFMYLIASFFVGRNYALLAVFIFSYCTPAWSTASRALWQHGPSMLMLTIALYLILVARERASVIPWTGMILAFSYVIRPTNSLSIIVLTGFIMLRYRQYFVQFVLCAALVAIPFVISNVMCYGAALPPYYSPDRIGILVHFWEALLGHVVSPSRGLLTTTPILIVAVYGILLDIRSPSNDRLGYFLLMIIGSHWLVISSFPNWYGGHSFGPRMFTDMIPYFMYFVILGLKSIESMPGRIRQKDTCSQNHDQGRCGIRTFRKPVFLTIVICLVAVSFFVHFRGATNWKTITEWNQRPVDVCIDPRRVWDWSDIQCLRGIL